MADDIWFFDRAVGLLWEVNGGDVVKVLVYRTQGSGLKAASEEGVRMTAEEEDLTFCVRAVAAHALQTLEGSKRQRTTSSHSTMSIPDTLGGFTRSTR